MQEVKHGSGSGSDSQDASGKKPDNLSSSNAAGMQPTLFNHEQ